MGTIATQSIRAIHEINKETNRPTKPTNQSMRGSRQQQQQDKRVFFSPHRSAKRETQTDPPVAESRKEKKKEKKPLPGTTNSNEIKQTRTKKKSQERTASTKNRETLPSPFSSSVAPYLSLLSLLLSPPPLPVSLLLPAVHSILRTVGGLLALAFKVWLLRAVVTRATHAPPHPFSLLTSPPPLPRSLPLLALRSSGGGADRSSPRPHPRTATRHKLSELLFNLLAHLLAPYRGGALALNVGGGVALVHDNVYRGFDEIGLGRAAEVVAEHHGGREDHRLIDG